MSLEIYAIDGISDLTIDDGFANLTSSQTPTIAIKFVSSSAISKDLWFNYLTTKFTSDTRHFGFDLSLDSAKWWEISNQEDKSSSYAYSTTQQPFHTDNAWFSDPAEINFFYMEKQVAVGGEQIFYPVSRLLNDLQADDPSLLSDLLQTTVTIKKGHNSLQNTTKILIDEDGGKVFWNFYRTDKTDPFVAKMCERFFDYLSHKWLSPSVIPMKLASGESAAFDDMKTLHGRNSFMANKSYQRVLLQSMWRCKN